MYHYFAKHNDKIRLCESTHPPNDEENVLMYLQPFEYAIAEILSSSLKSKTLALARKEDIVLSIDSIIAHVFPEEE